tara:strand:+ start:48287 stop:49042 length:756 start_codon:yes stop_codon:yes gene_type:complete
MAIVKEWGGVKVPEGFTYYMNGNFYNISGTSPTICAGEGKPVNYSCYSVETIKISGSKLPDEKPDVPEINWSRAPTDSAVWICTKVKGFADWWFELSDDGNSYKVFDGYSQYLKKDEGKLFTVHRRPANHSNLPLKTITTEVAEWDLVAGGECQILNTQLHNAAYENCVINFIGSYVFVYTTDSCEERFGHVETCEFRPIKTKEEKERDELKDFLLQHQPSADSSMSQIDIIEQYMTNLMFAGARTPKGGE